MSGGQNLCIELNKGYKAGWKVVKEKNGGYQK